MEGFILIDKPKGITSHDVVDELRKITGEKRIGHAGTLDPFATGLLIVAVSRKATREIDQLVKCKKTYKAVFVLGASSTTDDSTGEITAKALLPIDEEKIKNAVGKFIGKIEQLPPDFSAVKIGGKKMYEAARAGKKLTAKARSVIIYKFDLTKIEKTADRIKLWVEIECSSGTYIRALARDLGQALGTAGYVDELQRTAIADYELKDANALASLNTKNIQAKLIPIASMLALKADSC